MNVRVSEMDHLSIARARSPNKQYTVFGLQYAQPDIANSRPMTAIGMRDGGMHP